MTVLPDHEIRANVEEGRIRILPFNPDNLQPASIDVKLDRFFRVFDNHAADAIDPNEPGVEITREVEIDEWFVLHPGEFVQGQTLEEIALPDDIVARIEGKSTLGRVGLIVHSTAGFVDPGFHGTLTLELSNLTRLPIRLYYGMFIAQISFVWMSSAAERPYHGKYQGQTRPTPSRF